MCKPYLYLSNANAWLTSWVDFTYERYSLIAIYILSFLALVVIKTIFKPRRVISVVYFLLFNFMPLVVHNFKGVVSIIWDIWYILKVIKNGMIKKVPGPGFVFYKAVFYYSNTAHITLCVALNSKAFPTLKPPIPYVHLLPSNSAIIRISIRIKPCWLLHLMSFQDEC